MRKIFTRKLIDKVFEIGVLVKAVFGLFEILAGIAFAVSGKFLVNNIILLFAQQEVSDDPGDFILNFFAKSLHDFSAGSYLFAVVYLIFHGIINIALVVALLKNKVWGYHWAMVGFSIFIIYQVYRYSYTHSFLLLLLIIFDVFVVSAILLEYRSKKINLSQ